VLRETDGAAMTVCSRAWHELGDPRVPPHRPVVPFPAHCPPHPGDTTLADLSEPGLAQVPVHPPFKDLQFVVAEEG